MDIFDQLNDEGTSIIMITHELEIAQRARKINFIRDGILYHERKAGGEDA